LESGCSHLPSAPIASVAAQRLRQQHARVAVFDVDAVMMLRVQHERMNASFFPSAREYSRRYGLDDRRFARLADHAIVMHPGPMNRGMEISANVADSTRSVIVEQVTNGVAVRMAVLYLLLSGNDDASHRDDTGTEEATT